MAIGLIAMFLAAGIVAGCGDDEESSGSGQEPAADSDSGSGDKAEATGEPYEVQGSDPKLPPLVLQGWVPGGKASESYKIAYVGNTPVNTYVQAMEYGAETAADSLGVELDKIIAEWDSAQQINQLQNLLQQNQYDGVVTFLSDPNAECRMVSETLPDAGIPVVITNFPACGDRDYTEGTIGVSTSQSRPFYEAYADWAFGWLSENGGGKVGILSGPAVFGHAKELKKATESIAKKYDNIEIAQNLNADWTIEGGLSQGETLLQTHPDIKLFLSSYDQNTIGLVKALEAAGKKPGDIPVFTMGGDKVTFPMMDDGWIQGIQYLQPIEEVGQGVEMMVAHLDGAEIPQFNNLGDGSSHPAGTVQITPENKDQFKPQF